MIRNLIWKKKLFFLLLNNCFLYFKRYTYSLEPWTSGYIFINFCFVTKLMVKLQILFFLNKKKQLILLTLHPYNSNFYISDLRVNKCCNLVIILFSLSFLNYFQALIIQILWELKNWIVSLDGIMPIIYMSSGRV